jgi:hypothetical protein
VTRALVWKELREQWAVWLALAVAAVAGVAALQASFSPSVQRDEMLVCVFWLGAWGYGLVCGSLLLAGEAEDQTQGFLDLLPATRRQLWRTKAWAGLGLLAAQAALLATVSYFCFRYERLSFRAGVDRIGILPFGITGYAFGLYGGSRSATVLGGIGLGLLAQAVSGLFVFPFVVVTLEILRENHLGEGQILAPAVTLGLIVAGAVVRSRGNYCESDRLREPARPGRAARPPRRVGDEALGRTFWDVRWFAAGMTVVGLCGTPAATTFGAAAWPMTISLIGLTCGIAAFVGGKLTAIVDRAGGQQPAGRLILARAVAHFAVATGAALLTALVPLTRFVGTFAAGMLDKMFALRAPGLIDIPLFLRSQSFVYLPVWLVDGFAVGLICGVASRRSLVAGLLALPGACFLATLWMISRISGAETGAWQAAGAPAVLLCAAGTSVWFQASDKSLALRTVAAGAVATLAITLWIVAAW